MKVLDLFSGIGGFSLGLERAGMRTVAFCEIEPFCQSVLRKHWPDVPIYEDVRRLTAERLAADGIGVDVICGGFPCQDISVAGKGAGIDGERSGLWSEYARIIGEIRPRYVIVENVAALLGRGLDRVLGDMAALGFDAEWHCIPASAIGAPHRRDRVWIICYPNPRLYPRRLDGRGNCTETGGGEDSHAKEGQTFNGQRVWIEPGTTGSDMAYSERLRCHEMVKSIKGGTIGERASSEIAHRSITRGWGWWIAEPDVGRVADGVPSRVDRLKALGNAVVPQIPEIIGRAIMEINNETA